MATKQRSSAKADFIRSFPVTTPASEVVEKAKAVGLSVSPAHVYGVRQSMGSGRGKATGAASTRASRARGGAPNDGASSASKKAFVLSYPADTPAQEIVRAAAARGMDLSLGYLYWVRSEAGRVARRTGLASQPSFRSPGLPAHALTTPARAAASVSDAERLLVDTALRVVGIERAIAVLQAARGRLARLLDD